MLFKNKELEGIKSGEISLAFRKWKKPRVKKGSLIKTAIGQVEIIEISAVEKQDITEVAALNAGVVNKAELYKVLDKFKDGIIFEIQVRYHSEDPRIALREQTNLSDTELMALIGKLNRLDKFSKQGDWTLMILKAIRDNPKLRAVELASKTGKEKEWLKPNIRKLKNLGLTISHATGYSISPLGELVLSKQMKTPDQ